MSRASFWIDESCFSTPSLANLSILFATMIIWCLFTSRIFTISRSRAVKPTLASIIKKTALGLVLENSTYQKILLIILLRSDIERFAYPYPGKSTKQKESLMRKKFACRVFPGLLLTFTRSFLPTKELITLDFPALERPKKAICGKLSFMP